MACSSYIRQQTLGPQHPDAASSYNNFANVLSDQGDLKEAKEYHERALPIRQQTLGPKHSDAASSYYNLANVLSDQGDLKQAKGSIMSVLLLLYNKLWVLNILNSQVLITT